MTILRANGCTVSAPVCRVCNSDRDIIVKDFDDGSWAYFCTRCDRVIPFEEFLEGNP